MPICKQWSLGLFPQACWNNWKSQILVTFSFTVTKWLSNELRQFNFGVYFRGHSPSERVFTVWGNLADFIIAVKVMISVRSSRLQPVQSPFIRRIRCFWKNNKTWSYFSLCSAMPHFFWARLMTWAECKLWSCKLLMRTFPLPVTLHMLHLGSPSAAMRIQSIPCMLQQLTAADSLVLRTKSTNNSVSVTFDYQNAELITAKKVKIHTLSTYSGDVVCRECHEWWVERLILFVMVKDVRFTAKRQNTDFYVQLISWNLTPHYPAIRNKVLSLSD